MYDIILVKPGMKIPMTNDKNLTLAEASERIEVYKKTNPSAYYFVRDKQGNEFEL